MFADFNGLPLHPLVIHVVVVFAPLATMLAVAHLVPAWRPVLRWLVAGTASIAAVSAFVAKESGETLKDVIEDQLESGPAGRLVEEHEELGEKLFIALLVFAALALVVLAVRALHEGVLGHIAAIVLVLAGIVVGVLTFQTGEKGSDAVWNPTGEVDYSGESD